MTGPLSPLGPEGEAVLRVMQRRPLDWWYVTGGGIRDELKGGNRGVTCWVGLDQLEDHGLVTHRYEPAPGETEQEAQQAVVPVEAARDAACAALPWWKRWTGVFWSASDDEPRGRPQYRLTPKGRAALISAMRPEGKRTLGQPLIPMPLP